MTRTSIVIVTYGQRQLTEQCLRSLQEALGERLGRDWELVLVDNNSPDDTPELLRAWSDRAKVLLLEENRNFAGGCNAGAQAASGEALVFLNNDTEVPAGALETLVEQLREPGVGAAGCRLLYPDRTIQHAGVAFFRGLRDDDTPMPQHVLVRQPESLAATQAIFETDCVTAACVAVPAELFRSLGGFDECFTNGLEDVDLCLRIRASDRKIIYRGDVTLIHHEGASRGRGKALGDDPRKLALSRHNDARLIARWKQFLEQDDELASTVWDAGLEDPRSLPARTGPAADAAVVGSPAGVGPAADEARAFLSLWARHGQRVAAFDRPVVTVLAHLGAEEAAQLALARGRPVNYGAPILYVPVGGVEEQIAPNATVRVGSASTAGALPIAKHVWAPCRKVADALLDDGLRRELVTVVPPPVLTRPLGDGGGGVLVTLPVQDPGRAETLLRELEKLDRGVEITLLPTTFRRGLSLEVAERLPRARLLGPCSDEAGFAELAATMDVIVCTDHSDPFERRALVAAGAGAAALSTRPDGPAADVLGHDAVCEAVDAARAIGHALADSAQAARSARAAAVIDACGTYRAAAVAA